MEGFAVDRFDVLLMDREGAVRENVLELATLAEALDFAAAWCDDPGGLGVLIRPSQGGEP